ncbi:MAG: hypothetical protein EG825_10235 [Rhodocyclaceae bacterium]|nr:hypothetical protein [Rhodocyclaceae bacterium]
MLDWINTKFKKESDHPLGSEASLRQVLAQTPRAKPAYALHEISSRLEDTTQLSAELLPDALRRAVRLLDEGVRRAWCEAWATLFLATSDADLAEDVWLALHEYSQRLADAYLLCLATCPGPAKASASERAEYGLLATRTLAYLRQRRCLLRLRYRTPEAAIWNSMGLLVAQTRARGVNVSMIQLYKDDNEYSSPARELLLAAVFEAAPIENLSPLQMDFLQRLLGAHADKLVQRESPDERSPFWLNPETGVSRWNPAQASTGPGYFVGIGGLYAEILKLQVLLDKKQPLPSWMADSPCSPAEALKLLALLRSAWSQEPPKRKFRRDTQQGTVLVVHDFSQIRRMVAASAFARSGRRPSVYASYLEQFKRKQEYFGSVRPKSAEEMQAEEEAIPQPQEVLQRLETSGDKELMEHWQLADISAKGLGTLVPMHKKWLAIGVPIGYRPAESLDWQVAVVRRLSRGQGGRRLAGLELLPGIPVPVNHCPAIGDDNLDTSRSLADLADGILVSMEAGTLLLAKGAQAVGARLWIVGDGIRFIARLEELIEHIGDTDYFRFGVEKQIEA